MSISNKRQLCRNAARAPGAMHVDAHTLEETSAKACRLLRIACQGDETLRSWRGQGIDRFAVQLAAEAPLSSGACPAVSCSSCKVTAILSVNKTVSPSSQACV